MSPESFGRAASAPCPKLIRPRINFGIGDAGTQPQSTAQGTVEICCCGRRRSAPGSLGQLQSLALSGFLVLGRKYFALQARCQGVQKDVVFYAMQCYPYLLMRVVDVDESVLPQSLAASLHGCSKNAGIKLAILPEFLESFQELLRASAVLDAVTESGCCLCAPGSQVNLRVRRCQQEVRPLLASKATSARGELLTLSLQHSTALGQRNLSRARVPTKRSSDLSRWQGEHNRDQQQLPAAVAVERPSCCLQLGKYSSKEWWSQGWKRRNGWRAWSIHHAARALGKARSD